MKTGNDDAFVLDGESIQDSTVSLKNKGETISVPKKYVRKFIFGDNAKSWFIDWRSTYLIFPYEEIDNEFYIIPTQEYREFQIDKSTKKEVKFFAPFSSYPDEIKNLQDSSENLYKYFKSIEDKLRKRDNGRFTRGKKEEYRWYDLSRAQNLAANSRVKILIQETSFSNNVSVDTEGYFLAGARVYGIVPRNFNIYALASIISSKVADFYIKQVSESKVRRCLLLRRRLHP